LNVTTQKLAKVQHIRAVELPRVFVTDKVQIYNEINGTNGGIQTITLRVALTMVWEATDWGPASSKSAHIVVMNRPHFCRVSFFTTTHRAESCPFAILLVGVHTKLSRRSYVFTSGHLHSLIMAPNGFWPRELIFTTPRETGSASSPMCPCATCFRPDGAATTTQAAAQPSFSPGRRRKTAS